MAFLLQRCHMSNCHKESVIRCKACKFGYCHIDHQRENWPDHKDFCRKICQYRALFFNLFDPSTLQRMVNQRPDMVMRPLYQVFLDIPKFRNFVGIVMEDKDDHFKHLLQKTDLEVDYALSVVIFQMSNCLEDLHNEVVAKKDAAERVVVAEEVQENGKEKGVKDIEEKKEEEGETRETTPSEEVGEKERKKLIEELIKEENGKKSPSKPVKKKRKKRKRKKKKKKAAQKEKEIKPIEKKKDVEEPVLQEKIAPVAKPDISKPNIANPDEKEEVENKVSGGQGNEKEEVSVNLAEGKKGKGEVEKVVSVSKEEEIEGVGENEAEKVIDFPEEKDETKKEVGEVLSKVRDDLEEAIEKTENIVKDVFERDLGVKEESKVGVRAEFLEKRLQDSKDENSLLRLRVHAAFCELFNTITRLNKNNREFVEKLARK